MLSIIAEKREPHRTLTLEQKPDGSGVLWMRYPSRPDKDTGWPIQGGEIETVIAEKGLARVKSEGA